MLLGRAFSILPSPVHGTDPAEGGCGMRRLGDGEGDGGGDGEEMRGCWWICPASVYTTRLDDGHSREKGGLSPLSNGLEERKRTQATTLCWPKSESSGG